MPCRVHHHIHTWDEEETIIEIERPCANAGGLTKPSEFSTKGILMGVHVSDAAQINKQGIPFLNAKQHTVDRQAR